MKIYICFTKDYIPDNMLNRCIDIVEGIHDKRYHIIDYPSLYDIMNCDRSAVSFGTMACKVIESDIVIFLDKTYKTDRTAITLYEYAKLKNKTIEILSIKEDK